MRNDRINNHFTKVKLWKFSIAVSSLLLFPLLIQSASNNNAGTRSAVFLRDGQGARATALGGAYTAVGRGVSALFWNLGGMHDGDDRRAVMANYNALIEDINTQSIGVLIPSKKWGGSFGFSALRMNVDNIEQRDLSGNVIGESRVGGGVYSLSYGFRAGPHGFGVALKRVEEKLGNDSGEATAFDGGFTSSVGNLSVGISFLNYGSRYKVGSVENSLASSLRVGVAYEISERLFPQFEGSLLAFDMEKPQDGNVRWHMGGEYPVGSVLALRAGYEMNEDQDARSGIRLGMGVNTSFGGNAGKAFLGGADPLLSKMAAGLANLQVDYAYMMGESYEGLHRVSLTLQF